MKKNSKIFIWLFLFFIATKVSSANTSPPPPTAKGAAVAAPPPPTIPINEDLSFLIVTGFSLGIYAIYKHKLNTKASA